MKNSLFVLLLVGAVAGAQDLGPLANQTQDATGYAEFQQAIHQAGRVLSQDELIRELYVWGCAIVAVPNGDETASIGTTRFNLFLNPASNGSFVNRIYKAVALKQLKRWEDPRAYAANTLIADSTGDYNANISAKIQARYATVQSGDDLP